MDLQTLANVGEFLGGLAILVSLIYLVVNVRQNTAQLRESHKIAQRTELRSAYAQHDRYRMAMLDREIAELWVKGLAGGLTEPADHLRFENLFIQVTYSTKNIWDCAQNGIMGTDEWDRITPFFTRLLATPGGTKWWARNRSFFGPEFVNAIEAYRLGES